MNKDGLKEELQYLITAKNHLWVAALGTFGGSVGLMFINTNLYLMKWSFSISGFILTLLLLDNYFKKDDKIEKIIEFLKRKDI